MPGLLPLYDELLVVSDLHLGGPPECQIFNQGERLGALLAWAAERAQKRRVGFVINGDFVDFLALADQPGVYLDVDNAGSKLAQVAVDPAFAPVFSGLRTFTAAPGASLILVLGNHDLELTLPSVLSTLLSIICADSAARGRVQLALDGAGFRCRVGHAGVLCIHGNEADPWNVVDHEQLRLVRLAINRGREPKPWEPNAGTCLVIDVLNQVKQQLPMVDLLKPETEGVKNLLPIIYPESKARLLAAAPLMQLALRRVRGSIATGTLGGEQAAPSTAATIDGEAALRYAVDGYREGRDPLAAAAGGDEETLGFWQYAWDRYTGVDKAEATRRALADWLRDDTSFDYQALDETYERLDGSVGDADFLIAGHTHLARALARKKDGFYFNTGTWIRLIQLTPEVLGDGDRFAAVFAAITQKEMRVLDETPGVVLRRSTVAWVADEGDAVVGRLCDAEQQNGAISLKPLVRFARQR